MTTTAAPVWTVDGAGWLITSSGAKAARIADGVLMLYDKRSKCERALTLEDWHTVTQTQSEPEGAESHENVRRGDNSPGDCGASLCR
jgi:hypothetical protein